MDKPRNGRFRRRSPGPAAQVLLEAALDVIGAICILALVSGFFPISLLESAPGIILGVAGVDVVFRTSIRRMIGGAVRTLVGIPTKIFRRRKRSAIPAETLPDPGLPL